MVFNYGTIELFRFLPMYVYWCVPFAAIILAIVFKQVLQNVAQINEDFKEILHLMGGKCLSRKGILYRRLKAASVLGIRVVLVGGCSIAVKRGFKVAYACNVMDATVSLVVADPIRYLLGELV